MNTPSLQIRTFPDGGYVIHKITGDFKGRCSAWFANTGRLVDATQTSDFSGVDRPIKRNGPIWKRCQEVGRIHNPNTKGTK